MEWSIDGLKTAGFGGFVRFVELPLAGAPNVSGVYVVVRAESGPPTFIDSSIAGWFKGKDPTVPPEKLTAKWQARTSVLYIGKADLGKTGKRSIRRRLDEYRRHGAGEPVGHWGGRYLWQLADSDQLLVCWKETPANQAEEVESDLIADFIARHGALPFANLKRGRTKSAS